MRGTVYDKMRVLKEGLKKEFKWLKDREMFGAMSKLSSWHYPNKRTKTMKLTNQEAMIYEFLLKNNYNPSTCYKWMLACCTNEDLQKKLMKGEISMKKAIQQPYGKLSQTEQEFLYQIKLCIKKYVIR
ncbi:MAG: hypothetical protein ABIJ18_04095 [archaeon]